MITEIIFIILTFLITGYGIYRFGREEKQEQQIEVPNNVINNDPLNINNEFINNSINDEFINDNIINNNNREYSNNNINNINKENNINNRVITGRESFIRNFVLKNKSFVNLFEWGDIEKTAENLMEKFSNLKTISTIENIIEILDRIKKEEGEKVFRQWLEQKHTNDINDNGNDEKIVTLFKNNDDANIYKNTSEEIIGFLKKIRCDKKDLNSSTIIDNNENIININNEKMSLEKQVNEQIETNKKNINWKDLPGAAQEIYNCLNKDDRLELGALENIEDILKEKKSEGEEEAAMELLNKHKENINIETITTFVSSDENIYQNTPKEIIDILLKKSKRALSNGEYLQLQAIEMELLEEENKEEQKKLEEEKRREQEEKKKEEKRLKNIEDKAKKAQGKIVNEPEEGNPDAATIRFKYPDGATEKDRRFLKTDTIQDLYNFVTSLGKEIYSEENNEFSLWQSIPPKKYDNMENTLEEEGLFPNAVIQIREE